MTHQEIIKIIDTRMDMLQEMVDRGKNTDDFSTLYAWMYAKGELEQLKLIIKYEEDKKNGKN